MNKFKEGDKCIVTLDLPNSPSGVCQIVNVLKNGYIVRPFGFVSLVNLETFVFSHELKLYEPKRIISEIDPYGEENWEE